jgi:2-keto-4-pentenoate hydratase/2-oxohepta-3-ene-1,7-dioic acid hydratase in catechol pathway
VTHYVRFRRGSETLYGVLEGDRISPLEGELFGEHTVAAASRPLGEVKLLCPCEPRKIMAVGLNYRSHLGGRPTPSRPEIFFKPVSSLQNPGDPIVIPEGATDVHYEGELVVIIGQELKNASPEQARAAIFGVTCGNDVSERQWQGGPDKDLQWWRAKGADTFAPMGPVIARGLDFGELLLQTRLNGEVVQKQYTSDLLFDCPAIVSWVSRHLTLWPGDAIYTGTPGATAAMKPGDVVEVEVEGIGVLRNPVTGA